MGGERKRCSNSSSNGSLIQVWLKVKSTIYRHSRYYMLFKPCGTGYLNGYLRLLLRDGNVTRPPWGARGSLSRDIDRSSGFYSLVRVYFDLRIRLSESSRAFSDPFFCSFHVGLRCACIRAIARSVTAIRVNYESESTTRSRCWIWNKKKYSSFSSSSSSFHRVYVTRLILLPFFIRIDCVCVRARISVNCARSMEETFLCKIRE